MKDRKRVASWTYWRGSVNDQRGIIAQQEIMDRWHATVNERLQLDIKLTHPKWKSKAIPVKRVINTWKNTLENEEYLPKD